ncbi:MAG: PhnD/SsuA/transferrin family substrate-binding protein [Propionibacteriaceae bacterium]|nr:PhnD/SsuA/transferrin family substrate-binding protein [Propionibacteriaceae bacterium]
MTWQLAISPDVNVRNITDWFIFNTKIQRLTGQPVQATVYDDFADLHAAFNDGRADLVFANAANTATLVRDRGFLPLAAPEGVANEAAIVVAEESPWQQITDLGDHVRVAATDAPDVERICRILLEPADLTPESVDLEIKPNPILVAKAVLRGQSDVGFLPREAYDELSQLVRRQLRVLISSKIYVVRHSLLVSPALADQLDLLWVGLETMNKDANDRELLTALGAPNGWQRLTQEETEFMIDLMDALGQD